MRFAIVSMGDGSRWHPLRTLPPPAALFRRPMAGLRVGAFAPFV